MNIPNLKIWVKCFLKSFIWLILPLCTLGSINSCSSYINSGKHLTPYSVSVSGYYRSDGTYVRPYHRRPPGSVKHDAPYKDKQTAMASLFIICIMGGGFSIFIYVCMSKSEIEKQREIIEKIENKIRQEKKQKLINKIEAENKIRQEKRQEFINRFVEKMKSIFYKLSTIPSNLEIGKWSKCKFCKKYISSNEFYISFKAVSNFHSVCINCAKNRDSLGRNQPKSNFLDEIKYVENYNIMLNKFIKAFNKENEINEFTFSNNELKKIFDSTLKKYIEDTSTKYTEK